MNLIIQGDDWGYKPEASRGIEHSYEYGILTQTTAMVNTLDFKKKDEYKEVLGSLENKTSLQKPAFGIGVHFNLTYGKPLSPNWPTNEFTRPHKGSGKPEEWQGSAWAEYFSQFTKDQVRDEYRRQIELALDLFGEITHLDSHQMTASYEPMVGLYEDFAKEYDVPIRPVAPLSENPVYGGDFIVNENVNLEIKKRGIRMADKNIFKLFFNDKNPTQSFLSELEKIDGDATVEVMFHPAKGEKAEQWRKKDLDVLTDERVINFIRENDIELITYGDLG